MVEWALILPALLLILMVIIDLGRVVYTYSALFNSVREGARYAIIHPTDSTGISATIRHMAVGLDPSLITVTPTYNATARTIQIVATYQFAVVTPFASTFLGSNRVTLHTQTTMRTEQ